MQGRTKSRSGKVPSRQTAWDFSIYKLSSSIKSLKPGKDKKAGEIVHSSVTFLREKSHTDARTKPVK
jgi:hypothetical protein